MILDTNALSAAADDDPGVVAVLSRAEQMVLPVIVLGDIAMASPSRAIGTAQTG